jgi:hypothetical protein
VSLGDTPSAMGVCWWLISSVMQQHELPQRRPNPKRSHREHSPVARTMHTGRSAASQTVALTTWKPGAGVVSQLCSLAKASPEVRLCLDGPYSHSCPCY